MNQNIPNFVRLFNRRPQAFANIRGSELYPDIEGSVRFYQTMYGVLTVAQISGLPSPTGACMSPIFGFHIHEGESCSGNSEDLFANTKMHFNPRQCRHPYHAGDMPPLFGADGYAFSAFLSNRFSVDEIYGRTVVIHSQPDDFITQPSGNSGIKIACGEITRVAR